MKEQLQPPLLSTRSACNVPKFPVFVHTKSEGLGSPCAESEIIQSLPRSIPMSPKSKSLSRLGFISTQWSQLELESVLEEIEV